MRCENSTGGLGVIGEPSNSDAPCVTHNTAANGAARKWQADKATLEWGRVWVWFGALLDESGKGQRADSHTATPDDPLSQGQVA